MTPVTIDIEKVREVIKSALSYKGDAYFTIDALSSLLIIDIHSKCIDLLALVRIARRLCSEIYTCGQISDVGGRINLAFWKTELKAEFILPEETLPLDGLSGSGSAKMDSE